MERPKIDLIIGLLIGLDFCTDKTCDGSIDFRVRDAMQLLVNDADQLTENDINVLINALKVLGFGPPDLIADGSLGPRAIMALNEFLAIGQQEPVTYEPPILKDEE